MGLIENQRVSRRKKQRKQQTLDRAARIAALKQSLARLWRFQKFPLRRVGLLALFVGLGFALPVGIYQGYHFMKRSRHFTLERVELVGAQRLSETDIRAYLQLGDKKKPRNLVALDTQKLMAALHEHPWIRSAHVRKKLPDRLIVTITERRVGAFIALGRLYLVDKTGEIFKEAEINDEYELPIITGLKRSDIKNQKKRKLMQRQIRIALRIHQLFRKLGLQKRIPLSEIHIRPLLGFSLITDNRVEVRLGHRDFKRRLLKLAKLYPTLMRKRRVVSAIFLNNRRHPERVVVRYRGLRKSKPSVREVAVSNVPLRQKTPQLVPGVDLPTGLTEPLQERRPQRVQQTKLRKSRIAKWPSALRRKVARRKVRRTQGNKQGGTMKKTRNLNQYSDILP